MSPMLDEGRLIIFWGDDTQGQLLALDPATGKTLWTAASLKPAYSSVVAGVIGGIRQYVALTTDSVAGVEAATGRVLWTFPFLDQFRENIVTPIIDGERVIVSGIRKPTMLLEPVKGQKWSVKVSWQAADFPLYMSNPVVDGGMLYGLSSRDKGKLFTLNLKTGLPLWTSEGRFAGQAALAVAGKWLLVLTEQGELVVMDKNAGKPLETARYELAETAVYAQPVLAGKQVVIKDERALRVFLVP
jgi:outer membrane protein assembly factor BamB